MKNDSLSETHRRAYWRENLIIVSFILSIIFVDALNEIRMGGFRLGFWMAQQGSLYVFVILIFVYVWLMNRLDRKYGVEEQDADANNIGAAR